jgi:hypothetical protein
LDKVNLSKKSNLIDKLERFFYRIKWDLPNIHAIKTVDKHQNSGVNNEKGEEILRPRVLITDSEDKVREEIVESEKKGEKGWTAAHPWASPEFDISGDKRDSKEPTKEQKLMYKALHGEISDETETDGIYESSQILMQRLCPSFLMETHVV